ncbi:auxin-responsive protein SAUR50-like [Malania oleifera]|uniref:auxin-responsive protein SAUR50-like n=1 Tax=Malania oleifera TaxID=397392 RepID=UPI0025AEC045|nr:auxin-responsive protein SAUR50-like [Malania oleifera]
MAVIRALNGPKKSVGISALKILVKLLQKSLALARKPAAVDYFEGFGVSGKAAAAAALPEDVKQGHFAVIAVDNGKQKRFVVGLNYLSHPVFLRLLEHAAEEFGFDHQGALSIPCQWSELESILAHS